METGTSFGSKPMGFVLTLCGGLFWAIGGSCGQRIFQVSDATSDWLVPIRLLIAGAILLVLSLIKNGWREASAVWRNRRDTWDLLLFSLFGAGASQYTYYTCIQHSNAAFATVISYMFPVLILLYGMLHSRRPPKLYELVAVILVTAGAFICTTHLDLGSMSVSSLAIIFGLLCALTSAYHTVKPQRLLKTYPLMAIMGWSMFLGGLVLCVLCRPWTVPVKVNAYLVLLMAVVIIGGTIFAFCFFQAGVRIVGSLAGGVLAAVEPVGAVAIGALFLSVAFTLEDFIGFVLILGTIPLMAVGQRREAKRMEVVIEELIAPEAEAVEP